VVHALDRHALDCSDTTASIEEGRLLEPILDFLSRRKFGADRLLLGVEFIA